MQEGLNAERPILPVHELPGFAHPAHHLPAVDFVAVQAACATGLLIESL